MASNPPLLQLQLLPVPLLVLPPLKRKTSFDVVLKSAGAAKLKVVKAR